MFCVMTGNAIRKEEKTGTVPVLNHNRAIRITDIIGVVRIIAISGLNNACRGKLMPAAMPTTVPIDSEIKKPVNPRRRVTHTDIQKSLLCSKPSSSRITAGGGGRIMAASISTAAVHQIASRTRTAAPEMNKLRKRRTVLFCEPLLGKVEPVIRQLTSYGSGIKIL